MLNFRIVIYLACLHHHQVLSLFCSSESIHHRPACYHYSFFVLCPVKKGFEFDFDDLPRSQSKQQQHCILISLYLLHTHTFSPQQKPKPKLNCLDSRDEVTLYHISSPIQINFIYKFSFIIFIFFKWSKFDSLSNIYI